MFYISNYMSCGFLFVGSAIAMVDATIDISARLSDLRHSVLIIHGGADTVTCPSMSRSLYDTCEVRYEFYV